MVVKIRKSGIPFANTLILKQVLNIALLVIVEKIITHVLT